MSVMGRCLHRPRNIHKLKSQHLLRSTARPRDRRQDTELYRPSWCGPEVAGLLGGCRSSDKSGQPWSVAWNAYHMRSALDRLIEPNPSAFVHTAELRCVVARGSEFSYCQHRMVNMSRCLAISSSLYFGLSCRLLRCFPCLERFFASPSPIWEMLQADIVPT